MRTLRLVFILAFLTHSINTIGQEVSTSYLLGQFNPETDSRFIKLAGKYTVGSARGMYLRKEAYEAFIKMTNAASKDGINLVIISATRNFERQKQIWENKWKGKTLVDGKDLSTIADSVERAKIILRYSSMPGTSRHHWGTDMDFNSLENSFFESGEGLKMYEWLKKNAPSFGFCQPYTSKINSTRTGYEEEKWHWSYMPLASHFLSLYEKQIHPKSIQGFVGNSITTTIQIIPQYVASVSCK